MNTTYVKITLASLIAHISVEDRKEIILLVFLADFDAQHRNEVARHIMQNYQYYIESGFIQLMEVNKRAYPPLLNLKQNYGDKPDRVYWRSKQVVDFAFMFDYGRKLSQFYMQIEDDVISAPYFFPAIKAFIAQQKDPWVTLKFAELGFIGKLFRSTDLRALAQLLMLFYQEMPVDFLYQEYAKIVTLPEMPMRLPALFQHLGDFSSLQNKKNILREKSVNLYTGPQWVGDPPGMVHSSMQHYRNNFPQNAYINDINLFFWSETPQENDTLNICFLNIVELKSIKIQTGHNTKKNDFLRNGIVELCPERAIIPSTTGEETKCQTYEHLGKLIDGQYNEQNVPNIFKSPVKCLQIRVTKTQEEWIIIPLISIKVI